LAKPRDHRGLVGDVDFLPRDEGVRGAFDDDQVVANAGRFEFGEEGFGHGEGHGFVGVAMDEEEGRGGGRDVIDRRSGAEERERGFVGLFGLAEETLEGSAEATAVFGVLLEVGDGGEADDGLHAGIVACDEGGVAGELAAGGVAEERDAARVALEFARVGFHPADGGLHIFETGGPAGLKRRAVVEGEPGEAGGGGWLKPRRNVGAITGDIAAGFVAAVPASAVDQDGNGKRAVAVGGAGIEEERGVGGVAVGNVAAEFGGGGSSGEGE